MALWDRYKNIYIIGVLGPFEESLELSRSEVSFRSGVRPHFKHRLCQ